MATFAEILTNQHKVSDLTEQQKKLFVKEDSYGLDSPTDS